MQEKLYNSFIRNSNFDGNFKIPPILSDFFLLKECPKQIVKFALDKVKSREFLQILQNSYFWDPGIVNKKNKNIMNDKKSFEDVK